MFLLVNRALEWPGNKFDTYDFFIVEKLFQIISFYCNR